MVEGYGQWVLVLFWQTAREPLFDSCYGHPQRFLDCSVDWLLVEPVRCRHCECDSELPSNSGWIGRNIIGPTWITDGNSGCACHAFIDAVVCRHDLHSFTGRLDARRNAMEGKSGQNGNTFTGMETRTDAKSLPRHTDEFMTGRYIAISEHDLLPNEP